MNARRKRHRHNPLYYTDDAADFLVDILLAKPARKQLIERQAAKCGFTRAQLYWAKEKLGIIAVKERGTMTGGWIWARPEHVDMLPAITPTLKR